MHLRIPSPRWHGGGDETKQAHCFSFPVSREYDPWFGIVNGKYDVTEQDEAMRICNGEDSGRVCPLRAECLRFALKNNCGDGIWGGMHEEDRTRLRRFTKEVDWEWHPPTLREADRPQEDDVA
jgi:hypothetical protein